jgi:hypothetical protein
MYVYCDVASRAIVGDTNTPLLRICNVAGNHGKFVRLSRASDSGPRPRLLCA